MSMPTLLVRPPLSGLRTLTSWAADRAPFLRPGGERVERVPPHGVLVGDLVKLGGGDVGGHRGEFVGAFGQEESECG
jgi:hypothetical protein